MNYGQKENPIKLFNIRQGLEYLNNLRCDNGDYIIYHRLGSTNLNGVVIIDIYEIYTSSHKLDKIYITYVDEWLTDLRPPTGYSDAFLTCYYNEERISMDEAKELIKKYYKTVGCR